MAPQDVLFTPSFAPRAEYEFALSRGVIVTLDNVEALRNWPALLRGRNLWLRIDLGRGDGHHDKVKTGGKTSKFGLPLARLEEFMAHAKSLDIRIIGLHAHLGSGVETPQHWRQVCDELGGIADQIGTIESIDIGGGLPIPYSADDEPFDLEAWSAGLAEIKAAYPGYRLVIEPGRYLVAESGVLLTRVEYVKQRFLVVDAGMNDLIRPTLYDAHHDIRPVTEPAAAAPRSTSREVVRALLTHVRSNATSLRIDPDRIVTTWDRDRLLTWAAARL